MKLYCLKHKQEKEEKKKFYLWPRKVYGRGKDREQGRVWWRDDRKEETAFSAPITGGGTLIYLHRQKGGMECKNWGHDQT